MKPVVWAQTLLGIWLILSPFVWGYSGFARGNDIVIGLLVTIISLMIVADKQIS